MAVWDTLPLVRRHAPPLPGGLEPAEMRRRLIDEVAGRVHAAALAKGDQEVERLLLDGFYHEHERLSKVAREPGQPEEAVTLAQWEGVRQEVFRGSVVARREVLGRIIRAHAEEIAGHFNQQVYDLSTSVLPPALNLLLHGTDPKRIIKNLPHVPRLKDTFVIDGQKERIQRLVRRGTVVLVPTHFSHLDSILVGYGISALGMPPFTYGAGLNLFTNPLLSFFMHRLGAYKVDRKKRHEIYKEVLKTYCTVSLEMGQHNLFFPGGTRARNGAVEDHLKKGLLGCGLAAYIHNLQVGKPEPRIFIVPATLSYQLVLEAETLIEDFLKEKGKNRVIIEKDESHELERIARFFVELVKLDSKIYLTFGRALDPFGNEVDDDGVSLDPRGRPIDIERYVWVDGKPQEDVARDHQYTNELAERITVELHRANVIQSTHLVARATFRLLRRRHPNVDLYRLLRTGERTSVFALDEVTAEVEALLAEVTALAHADRLKLDPQLKPGRGALVVHDALAHFATYHTRAALMSDGAGGVAFGDLNLVYYYQHRLDGYGLA